MRRRDFNRLGIGAVLAAAGGPAVAAEPAAGSATATGPAPASPGKPLRIAMLVHPDMVMLDLVGPQTVFSLLMAEIHLVWKDPRPVPTDIGLAVQPTRSFEDCPRDLDVLFVPGGLKGSV